MKTAVMYGAGNIGRGFIGTLFSASGYRTVFVDVSDPVVENLNREGCYPVRILSGETYEDISVENVCAVNGTDVSAVADAIAKADIMATAVGVNVLKHIVPNIVAGLRRRKEAGNGPLNILICENLMDANRILGQMLKENLTEEESCWFDENVGLVETSIGRMVPVQTEEMKAGHPLRVCVERYGYLPVDRSAFKGEIPEIKNMMPFDSFDFYVKRKLYIHNMGHAVCAYLGNLLGLEYIAQTIDREEVYLLVKGAMEESALALSRKYGADLGGILEHIDDLLYRFTNTALKDTCKRVGGDPKRKLSPGDRLIGAANLALEVGVLPAYIAVGAAAALHRYLDEAQDAGQTRENACRVLSEVSGLSADSKLGEMILTDYSLLCEGSSLSELRRLADRKKAALRKEII